MARRRSETHCACFALVELCVYTPGMAEPTSIAGVVIAACGVLASTVAYLFREWNKERRELIEKLEKLQADRVSDAQTLMKSAVETVTESTETHRTLVELMTELKQELSHSRRKN